MKLVLQRVSEASVTSEGKLLGQIGKGYVALLGVSATDTQKQVDKLVDKVARLRIFEDENGKTNLSAQDVGGEILVISQFTLYADCRKGNRPSFVNAGPPALAEALYDAFVALCKERFPHVACGSFGADMQVSLVNDGPFTVVLEDEESNA